MEITLSYNGAVYGFYKSKNKKGNWYCISGKIPGYFGNSTTNLSVPLLLENELYKEAMKQNLLKKEILLSKKTEKRKNTVKVLQKKNIEGFNPFKDSRPEVEEDNFLSEFFDVEHSKEKNEISSFEEIESEIIG